jgi:glycosyltransferase involved in cell wall biosynthesis
MKIAYFITGLGVGGAEVVTLDLARRALAAGHRVMVVYLSDADTLAAGVPPGIGLFALRMRKTPAGMLAALAAARRIVRDFRPDIVHSNMFHSNIFTRLLRLIAPIPALICSEHTTRPGSVRRVWAYRLTSFLSNLDTNVSQAAVDEFVRLGAFRPGNAEVVYNGVDTVRFSPDRKAGARLRRRMGIADDEFVWLNVGRLTEAKDQAVLLKAFDLVGRGRLIIVGDGELRGVLEARIETSGLHGKAILAGAHSDTLDFYNAADCFVLSSAWEGFGIVLVEAMSCELPVIATDSGGCAEVVQNREFIVPPCNEVALAQKMLYVVELSGAQRLKLGRQNRALAARFDLDAIWRQWEQIYIETNENIPNHHPF